ncbi:hypothetical protein BUALT_Bualt09G0045600 [Buddleja alternifolia]|uniref:Embryogenesis-associated protein EMB8 n=1 Tax=Buddleja alternifolia TaxID=168488 RepID=A0AAV6XAT8_9LAMI|nr:hypothetical protein BUALT_Bualt09G0045600 [Buddleja alternifolia]
MSLALGHTEFLLPPSPQIKRAVVPSRHHHRAWKRRRLKPLTLRCHFNLTPSPFDTLFHTLISQFPSVNAINYIAPTLGFASALALFFSSNPQKLLQNPKSIDSDIGEWILFTSPTPFNRFVTLRCPSIYFPGNELLENVNEKLVKEDRHYVKLNSGRMIGKSDGEIDETMVYQRVCVSTEDGGVLSLDWPANLDLEEERGLDTTVFIVPGSAEGSNERKIRLFVCECLRRGVFPVVMNPRGSAGSPLTTARLFTAADSDDISTVVQFINKKRPWTTLMGVGWGYGANMMTKYLAELGEKTPLTAATCIDNPFDLEEATRSSVYNMDFDQRHTSGLINILECNKELFQGRGKGFDVEGALSASSIRDFEEAVSMVPYGFDTIEDFYAESSTRDVVGKVKIPVLFIQNDDGTVPLFSIPRSSIAENPYTSLLLCSYSPSTKIMDGRLTLSWCQHLIIEWLTAVELGLLKGRHPLLNDVDVNINPSKGLSLVENRGSSQSERVERLLKLSNVHSTNSPLEMFKANDTATSIQSRSRKDIGGLTPITKGSQQEDSHVSLQSSATIDTVEEEGVDPSDNDIGQVLQTAQVVMNMLDMTMPDTLSDEQKKKVLNAVGQGETLVKALQDAVPEDVRGKLTSVVSGILQSRGSNLKFDKLLSLGHIPDVASGLNPEMQEKDGVPKANGDDNIHFSDQKIGDDPGNGSYKVDSSSDKPPGNMELEKQSPDISQKPNDTGLSQSTNSHDSNSPDLEKVNLNDMGNSLENEQSSGGKNPQTSDRENVSEINANQESSSPFKEPGGAEDNAVDQKKVERESVEGQSDPMEETNNQQNDSSTDQKKGSEAYDAEDKSSAPSPDSGTEVMENEAESSQKKEEKGPTLVPSPNSNAPPNFSVSQALDALTGFDDSTQVAVKSVFNVIEDMIDNLEEGKDNEDNLNEVNETDEAKELSESSISKNHLMNNDHKSQRAENLRRNESSNSGNSHGTLLYDPADSGYEYKEQHHAYGGHNTSSSDTNNTKRQLKTENEISDMPSAREHSAGNLTEPPNSSSEKIPSYLTTFPYGDPLYKEYLKTYLYSKMRNAEPLNVDTTSALYLKYIPEEGQWKLLEQTEDNSAPLDEYSTHEDGYREDQTDTVSRSKSTDNIIEPSYVILDSGKPDRQNEELEEMNMVDDNIEVGDAQSEGSILFIKNLILECLNVEVGRRASAADMEELELQLSRDIEHVASAVTLEAAHGKLHLGKGSDDLPEKLGTIDGENMLKVISSAVEDTQYLKRVLPVGVIVGASLAALRKFFNVAALDNNDGKELALDQVGNSGESLIPVVEKGRTEKDFKKTDNQDNFDSSIGEGEDNIDLEYTKNNNIMVGAVTAALGASAFLVHQQNTETDGNSNEPLIEKENSKDTSRLGDELEKPQNMVTSLAEKAMSVAGPVVPTKDGEVDHERLVAMLTELGQKGGILRLVGKVALLWGGIRGAMSLTDKLISFLRIAERPLLQRILGFVSLVLLLWSPVVVPLLPTLIGSWGTRNPFKVVEFACIAGLYGSIMIMVTLWGKRIRKYDDPLPQYGLDLASFPKFQNFLKGLVGGVTLVLLIHSVNASLGCAHLCWPTTLSPSTSEPVALVKSYGRMLMLIFRGTATATGVSIVEELLFRSWLPREIADDFGYHRSLIISGLVFALSQRSTWEIPGLWLLSLSLSGAQQRSQGSLSLPIGLRTGILASNFILKTGGFLTYQPNLPLWVTGGHPFQPFSGMVGVAFSLVLAVILYPRRPL